ncbi:MAG: hypothetical protein AB7H97_13925 [Pseudobdellovibrionaceae bacterium]
MSLRQIVRKASVLLAFTFLVVTFQNCGVPKPRQTDATSTDSPTVASKVDLKQVSRLEFGSKVDADLDLNLDLNSGVISAQNGKNYCLSDSELNEVKAIFSSASVCDENESLPADTVCTMVYVQAPYALVSGDAGDVRLGEIANGCGKKVDLCGQYSDMLKGFLSHVSSDLESRACTFESI